MFVRLASKMMPRLQTASLSIALMAAGACSAQAQGEVDLHGFVPGSTLVSAQENADVQGLELILISPELDMWAVAGTNLTLSVCDERVAVIGAKLEPSLEALVRLVEAWEGEHGQSETSFAQFHAGATPISVMDVRFPTAVASRQIQFGSYDGELKLHASLGAGFECSSNDTKRAARSDD